MSKKQRPSPARKPSKQVSAGKRHTPVQFEVLRKALAWVLEGCCLTGVVLHGNATYQPMQLIQLAILWAWSEHSQLSQAYASVWKTGTLMFGDLPLPSYTGFIRALASSTERLRPVLRDQLQKLMVSVGGELVRVGGFFVLAVDGSRGTTPWTKSNEAAFSVKTFGQSQRAKSRRRWKNKRRRTRKVIQAVAPQYWLTKLWHMGLKMPWEWKVGPSYSCERVHLLEMLANCHIPDNTLLVADAGFVGYEFLRSVREAGHDFMIRVGANVRLVKNLGHVRARGDMVHLWPTHQMKAGQPPLMLRHLKMQGPRGVIHVLTSVLDRKQMPDSLAAQIYRMRWGIELQFRTLKQTFGRGKLRSRNGANATAELEWSIFALWIIQLWAVKEQLEIESPPAKCSVGHAIQIFRELLRDPTRTVTSHKVLVDELRAATLDDYQRTKPKRSRHRAGCTDLPSTDPPQIKSATTEQQQYFRKLNKTRT